MTTTENEPRLMRVAVHICENCIAAAPGQCHVPGCLFCRWNIEDTPQPLQYLVEHLDNHTPDFREAIQKLKASHAQCNKQTRSCPWGLMWDEDIEELMAALSVSGAQSTERNDRVHLDAWGDTHRGYYVETSRIVLRCLLCDYTAIGHTTAEVIALYKRAHEHPIRDRENARIAVLKTGGTP